MAVCRRTGSTRAVNKQFCRHNAVTLIVFYMESQFVGLIDVPLNCSTIRTTDSNVFYSLLLNTDLKLQINLVMMLRQKLYPVDWEP